MDSISPAKCEHDSFQPDSWEARADLVGRMVWRIVDSEAPKTGRSIFLLTGLEPRHLVGVSRMCPELEGRRLRLAISPRIDPDLLSNIVPAHLSDDPPVSFRNSNGADVVVLAVPDTEREAVGSSLGNLIRIDRARLQSETQHWRDEIKEGINGEDLPQGKTAWLEAMIRGLDMSGATNELDQFAEFVERFIAFPDGWLFTERLRQLGPVLNLPRGTFDSIPSESSGHVAKAEDFRRMFRNAQDKYSGIAYLRSPDDKRLDADAIMERVRIFRDRLANGKDHLDDPSPDLLDAVAQIVKQQSRLRRGDWLPCQTQLCNELDWSQCGEKLFGVRTRKKTLNLAEKTIEHFEREYEDKLPAVKGFLDEFKDPAKPQSDDVKEAFFSEHEDLIRTNKRLYEEWRRHLFASTVKDQPDLLTAMLDGVQAVLIKNLEAEQELGDDIRFYVAVKDCDKASTWESLDRRTYALFRQEARLISGTIGERVAFRFGKWLDPDVIKAAEDQTRKESRILELEVGIARSDPKEESHLQRVRVFWRPSESGKDSIALAWPEDIEGLIAGMDGGEISIPIEKITPRGTSASRHLPMSIQDTSSFSDAAKGEKGRTADPASKTSEEDFFESIPTRLADLADRNIITNAVKEELSVALSRFRTAFSKTIYALWGEPEHLYDSALIREQANLFGDLCSKARTLLSDTTETRLTVMREICEFAVLASDTSHDVAIIPAWHPLRLLERQEKAKAIATFIETICADRRVTVDGLERACRKYREMLAAWCFPEVASIDFRVYSAVEHCGGYSLAVPVDAQAGSMEALEASSRKASQLFMRVADEYLALNPHEENNFSTAIYNAETVGLPAQIAESLERKMNGRDNLRCSLLITHDKPAKMREAYSQQTALLRGKNLGGPAAGFLSRLRVGVRTGTSAPRTRRRPDIDIVFLHEAFFRNSEIAWDFVRGASDEMDDYVDLANNLLPRRQGGEEVGGSGAGLVQIALSPLRLPRPVAQFVDLVFATQKDVRAIKTGHRAIPIRRISWDSDAVRTAIKNAHDLAEWVVSFDHLSSREMLAGNNIKIIRDVLVPGTEARLLVSSREPSPSLLHHIAEEFREMGVQSLSSQAERLADLTVETVVQAAGQKVMAAARSRKTALEIIGLAAATAVVRGLQHLQNRRAVWFSLDDNRATFGLREKVADTLAVSVEKAHNGRFIVNMIVVEAKCVAKAAEAAEAKSSRLQTLSTMRVLRDNFVEQDDPVAARAWGADLLSLLSLRPEFARLLETRDELDAFKDDLVRGRAIFKVQGRSVIVLHDDETAESTISGSISPEDEHLIQHRVGQRALAILMAFLGESSSAEALKVEDPLSQKPEESRSSLSWKTSRKPAKQLDASKEREPSSNLEMSPGLGAEDRDPSLKVDEEVSVPEKEALSDADLSPSPIPEALRQELLGIAEATGVNQTSADDAQQVKEVARRLQQALMGYGIQAEFVADKPFTATPNGVIVRFKGHDTLTVKKAEARQDELKSTHALDVISIKPGLGEVIFYVARKDRQIVSLADVWLRTEWPATVPDRLTSCLIGTREDNGAPLWLNLTDDFGGNSQHGPHTLIAGETGSGKGVLIQNLLLQLIAFNSPDNLKLYVIDPKLGADFFWISEAPHLVGGITATQEDAETVLDELVAEMERRYALIASAKTPNISEYNKKVAQTERLPRIIVFHDEMADWMADSEDYRKMIQAKMTRIASKARACGMNIFLITQRASQDAIPVGIRDNLNNRLCLKVASKAGSMIALKEEGGEKLLGRGHLAASLSGDRPTGGSHFTAQVPFATTGELESLGRAAIATWI